MTEQQLQFILEELCEKFGVRTVERNLKKAIADVKEKAILKYVDDSYDCWLLRKYLRLSSKVKGMRMAPKHFDRIRSDKARIFLLLNNAKLCD